MSLRHQMAAAAALGATLLATGCGSGGGSSVRFTGDVSGTWSKAGEARESTCGSTEAVIHIQGPASGDEGDLHVKSDGSVWLDAEKYGDFTSTKGGTLEAGKGFKVEADVATVRGKKAHISGELAC